MRFALNILLVVLFITLPVVVHGTSDLSMNGEVGIEQPVANRMVADTNHDEPCASRGPNCQTETLPCMMDCCLLIGLNPVPFDIVYRSYCQGDTHLILAATDPNDSFRPPIV